VQSTLEHTVSYEWRCRFLIKQNTCSSTEPNRLIVCGSVGFTILKLSNQFNRAISQPFFSTNSKVLTSVEYGDVAGAQLNSSAISISVRYKK